MIGVTGNKDDAGAILGHLTGDQRRQLAALDAAYIELLSRDASDKDDVEGVAEAVVAFYNGLVEVRLGAKIRR